MPPGLSPIEKDLVQAATDSVLKPYHDLLVKLLGPAAEESGLMLRTALRVFHVALAAKLFQKVNDWADEAGIPLRPVPLRLFTSIVERASAEEDEEMHDRWAALLANAADPSFQFEINASFVQILEGLQPHEAVVCDILYEHFSPQSPEVPARQLDMILTKLRIDTHTLLLTLHALARHRLFEPKLNDQHYLQTLGQQGQGNLGTRTTFGNAFVTACRRPQKKGSGKT